MIFLGSLHMWDFYFICVCVFEPSVFYMCLCIYDSTGMSAEAGSSVLYEKVDAMVSLKLAVNTQDAVLGGLPFSCA